MLESVLSIPEGMLSLEDKGRNFNIKLSKSKVIKSKLNTKLSKQFQNLIEK
jgi:hypothetical protein